MRHNGQKKPAFVHIFLTDEDLLVHRGQTYIFSDSNIFNLTTWLLSKGIVKVKVPQKNLDNYY